MERKIPEIDYADNKVVLPTLEVPIIFNKKQEMVKLQKLTAGRRRIALKKHLTSNIRGSQVNSNIEDPVGIQITLLSHIIVDAPFDHTEAGLANLPEEVVDYLFDEYEEWTKKKVTEEDISENSDKDITQTT